MNCDDTYGLASWGWTALSSYSSSALDFEREFGFGSGHESLRMSRRSLRLHTDTSHYGDNNLFDLSLNPSAIYCRKDDKLRSRRAYQSFSGSTAQTPRPSTSFLQAHNSTLNSGVPSDASLLYSLLDESYVQERTLVDSFCGWDEDGDIKDRGHHSAVEAKLQTSNAQNEHNCKDCSFSSDRRENHGSPLTSSVRHTDAGHQASFALLPSSASFPTASNTTVYCRDNRRQKTGLLLSMWGCCVRLCKRFSGFTVAVLRKTLRWRKNPSVTVNEGNEKYYSTMSVKEVVVQERPKHSGVLCDDCKRKNTQHYHDKEPVGDLWSLIVLTGKAASASVLRLVNLFAQFLPMLSKLLFLVPFLLFLAMWYWGPSGLVALLPSANHHKAPKSQTFTGDAKEGQSPVETNTQRASVLMSSIEAERFARLEENLAQLWDRVAGGLLRQEEQHTEVLSLYNTLRVEFHRHTDRESMAKWIGDMLEERFSYLKGEVEKQSKHTQQNREKHKDDGQSENTRLAEAEALLQTLARRTEELQRKQEQEVQRRLEQERAQRYKVPEAETGKTDPDDSDESDGSSSEVVLSEVKRLDDELDRIRDDVQGLMGCKDRCEQLDVLKNSVSEHVEKEVRSLFYGSDTADELKLPESLMQWLSDQFVSTTELQVSLRALESSILGNLSLQIEENQSPSKETITKTVLQATGEAGLTEDDVQLIVNNALKIYSQDRTGLVDYALESGGGSILGTRCTVLFDTKTALMSLFGIPLWYFSQSPRVVIQPDVHPGNCWAFKGSTGFLVIGLALKIVPTAFSLEHIPKSLSPTGNISSAPREFSVYGLEEEYEEDGQLLGQFTYDDEGDALQTFSVTEEVKSSFQIIEMRVLSNWGHPEYTCMYRFRVHGELAEESDADADTDTDVADADADIDTE
ncbi:SUN domain-containing protein 1 isoform X2 [Paramisgurnus dabryanus]|uniref:SUN domain-containing protein 1 isoform X2 n=1 Tax=Paramisgurnus dabryanus TaxID=90735 RepID=UPI003CCF79E7